MQIGVILRLLTCVGEKYHYNYSAILHGSRICGAIYSLKMYVSCFWSAHACFFKTIADAILFDACVTYNVI